METMSYKHLSITERELLLIHLTQGKSLCQIAKILGRNKSTISRELARNSSDPQKPKRAIASDGKNVARIKSLKTPTCSRWS